jgi:lysyl-tRNA synthetase class 2
MPSSVIRRFDYDPVHRALDIEFVSGRRYRYATVPASIVDAFRQAVSKGRFFNARIRDRFAFVELEPEESGGSRNG